MFVIFIAPLRFVARSVVLVVAVFALSAAALAPRARAQVVFEDNFDGGALLPHWITPPASHWDYDVSGGMLNVHRLLFPSHPKSPTNDEDITAVFASGLSDFESTVRVGFEPGHYRVINFIVSAATNSIGIFSYTVDESGAQYAVRTPLTPNLPFPAPISGMHSLTIRRHSATVSFLADGVQLATLPSLTGAPISLSLGFTAVHPAPALESMHVDFVRLVPAPGSFLGIASFGLLAAVRRR